MAIFGVDGANGQGKTTYAVAMCWRAYQQGERIYSNTPLVDWRVKRNGFPYDPRTYGKPWARYIRSMDDLLRVRRGTVLLTEADLWFSAREWNKVSPERVSFWTQHRKQGLDIWWDCTNIDNLLGSIRSITLFLHTVQKLLPRLSRIRVTQPRYKDGGRGSYIWFVMGPHVWGLHDTNWVAGDGSGNGQNGAGGRQIWTPDQERVGTALIRRWDPVAGLIRYERPGPDDDPADYLDDVEGDWRLPEERQEEIVPDSHARLSARERIERAMATREVI